MVSKNITILRINYNQNSYINALFNTLLHHKIRVLQGLSNYNILTIKVLSCAQCRFASLTPKK